MNLLLIWFIYAEEGSDNPFLVDSKKKEGVTDDSKNKDSPRLQGFQVFLMMFFNQMYFVILDLELIFFGEQQDDNEGKVPLEDLSRSEHVDI